MPPPKSKGEGLWLQTFARTTTGAILMTMGVYVLLASIIHWKQIQHFSYVFPIREKIVYKDPPVPPEPGYDTGNVIVKYEWEHTDAKGKRNGENSGQYQIETPDGVMSLLNICPTGDIFPSLGQGEKVNIHIIPDEQQKCSKFVRARRWQ
jgi:hypothetical protein